jgi:hypothetical protein
MRPILYMLLALVCFEMGRMCFTYSLCWYDWLGQQVCAPIIAMTEESRE